MKKKVVLISAVVLLAVVAVTALVACSSHPYDFFKDLKDAKNWTATNETEDGTYEVIFDNGNLATIMKDKDGKVIAAAYIVKEGEKYKMYEKTLGEDKYSASEITKTEYDQSEESIKPDIIEGLDIMTKESFVQEDDYWFAKILGTVNKEEAYKISGNTLTVYKQKADESGYEVDYTIKLSGKVSVPAEAKS